MRLQIDAILQSVWQAGRFCAAHASLRSCANLLKAEMAETIKRGGRPALRPSRQEVTACRLGGEKR
jgi:hypothetical protein